MKKTPPTSGRAFTEGPSSQQLKSNTSSKCYLSKPKNAHFYSGQQNSQRCSSIHTSNSQNSNHNNIENIQPPYVGQEITVQGSRLSMESQEIKIGYSIQPAGQQQQQKQQQQVTVIQCKTTSTNSCHSNSNDHNMPLKQLQFEQQLLTNGQGLNSKLSLGLLAAKYGKTTKDTAATTGIRQRTMMSLSVLQPPPQQQALSSNAIKSPTTTAGIKQGQYLNQYFQSHNHHHSQHHQQQLSLSKPIHQQSLIGDLFSSKKKPDGKRCQTSYLFTEEQQQSALDHDLQGYKRNSMGIMPFQHAIQGKKSNIKSNSNHNSGLVNKSRRISGVSSMLTSASNRRNTGTTTSVQLNNGKNNSIPNLVIVNEGGNDLNSLRHQHHQQQNFSCHLYQPTAAVATMVTQQQLSYNDCSRVSNEEDDDIRMMQGTEEDDEQDDNTKSFFCREEDEQLPRQTNFVNLIPVSPKKKHKPNNELDFFQHNTMKQQQLNCENYQQGYHHPFSLQQHTAGQTEPEQFNNSPAITASSIPQYNQSNTGTIFDNQNNNNNRSLFESISVNLKNVFKSLGANTAKHTISKHIECQCYDDDNNTRHLSNSQTCQRAQLWLQSLFPENDLEHLKQMYLQIKSTAAELVDASVALQIDKDIGRTHPELRFFSPIIEKYQQSSPKPSGQDLLRSVLVSFAAYDPQVGYVQGLNFIASHFLFHAEEHIAFWLLVNTFERFEMRDIYLPNLPGLRKHSNILEKILGELDPLLAEHFFEQDIRAEMYMTPWLLSLFGMMIPLKFLDTFFEKMIEEGWCFFYKFLVSYIFDNRDSLLQEDAIGIMSILSSKNNQIAQVVYKPNKQWIELINNADSIPLSQRYVQHLIDSFNEEGQEGRGE